MITSPPVDKRDAAAIAAKVRELFPKYLAGWPPRLPDQATEALTNIFARYCEIVIRRLNRAPEKSLLAFLDLLGAEPLPVQAARAPLTFHLTSNARNEVVVPAFSQITAPASKPQGDPVLFETEQEFTAIPAKLDALLVKQPSADRYADYSLLLEPLVNALQVEGSKVTDQEFLQILATTLTGKPPVPQRLEDFLRDSAPDKRARAVDEYLADGVALFAADMLIEHSLFLSLGDIAAESLDRVTVHVEISQAAAHSLPVEWTLAGTGKATVLTLASDGTAGFTKTGDIVFDKVPVIPESLAGGVVNRWLKCRLLEPVAGAMPHISRLTVTAELQRTGIPVEKAFSNAAPLDITRDFYAFGTNPRFGDTLYLASKPAFSVPGATVTLHVKMTNPTSAGNASPVIPVQPKGTELAWEFWDGKKWTDLGVSDFGRTAPWPSASFADTTNVFSESGDVTFQFSSPPQPIVLLGQEGYWIRVRIVFGDYGHDVVYERDPAKGTLVPVPSTLRPPVIHSIDCAYRVANSTEPESLMALNDFGWERLKAPFPLFRGGSDTNAYAYLGFSSATGYFPGRSMNVYLALARSTGLSAARTVSAQSPLLWEYWNGLSWAAATVRDDTSGFRRSGVIRFLTPADFSAKTEFGILRYWWRVHRPKADGSEPRLRRALLNTVMASNTQTTFGEVLGSSNGMPGQVFHTSRKPVLVGQRLEILEPRMPTTAELRRVLEEEGASAVNNPELASAALNQKAIWIRWHEVANFTGSDTQDRHYVLDHETGAIIFGDGVHGKLPPAGTNNVRLYRYQTGGGSSGNVPAFAIAQLKTTVPYVESAVNLEPSGGGADPESLPSMINRAPRITRHNYRAITQQDFEDLATLASPGVAKARCVPGFDLIADPDCTHLKAGVVSLVVVPRSSDSGPMPDSELLDRVRAYLDERTSPVLELILVSPEFVRIDVKAEVSIEDPGAAGDVEVASRDAITRYLHPLSGGVGARGWDFGRLPLQSDFYSLLETVPGVSHVRQLTIKPAEQAPGVIKRQRFLIREGVIRVTTTLDT